MDCVVDLDGVRFNFIQNKFKQKALIDVLMLYLAIELNELSEILDIPSQLLNQVLQGEQFLHSKAAHALGKLFLLTFSSPGRF